MSDNVVVPEPAAEPDVFELDLSADLAAETATPVAQPVAGPTSPAPTAPPAAPAADPQLLLQQAQQALREANEIRAQVQPYLQAMRTQAPENRPPVDPAKIRSGEASYEEFLAYQEWQQRQLANQILVQAEQRAASASSEQRARGELSASTLGEGNDYDSMRSRYLEPLYRQDGSLRELIGRVAPANPALGEYWVALMIEQLQQYQNNPVQLFNAIRSAGKAMQAGGDQVRQNIQKAEQAAAARIMPAGAASRGTPKTATDFARMTDEQFAAFEESIDRQLAMRQ